MNGRHGLRLLGLVCVLGLIAGGAFAQAPAPAPTKEPPATEAQPSETEIAMGEEITVTARQVSEKLVEIPATVSVMTDSQLDAVGVERAKDFVKLVPGVTMVNAAEVGDAQVNIRGINGSRDAENSFAFIVDGILMTNPAAFNREFSDLRQIEVLKGPQGALYGRNAAAGAIIVTTAEPGDEFAAEVTTSAAEDSSYRLGFTLGGPLGTGSKRFQLRGDWRTTDGFYANDFLGKDGIVDNFEAYDFGGRFLFDSGKSTHWDFKGHIGKVEAAAITFNATFHLPAFAAVLESPAFFEDVNDHEFKFLSNIDPKNKQDAKDLSVKLDHQFDWGSLTAWALYSNIENSFLADGTSGAFGFFNAEPNCAASTAALFAAGVKLPAPQFLGPTPAQSIFGPYTPTTCDGTQYQVRNQEDMSFEARLSGKSGTRLRWQGGLYYLTLDREVGVNLGIDRGLGVVESLFVPRDGTNPTEQLVHDQFNTDASAIFGALFFDARDDLEVSLALRYDREARDVHNLVPVDARSQYLDFTLDGVFSGGAPLNPGLDPGLNPSGRIPDKSKTFTELQPKLSGTWKATDQLSVFGNWGVGFKSGGFNNAGSKATVDLFINQLLGTDLVIADQFDKETSSAFEVGFKADSKRFFFTAAAYHVDVTDMQFFEFLVGPFGLLRVVSNIDDVKIEGAEIGLNWRAHDHLNVSAGFNLTDSEIKKNSSRPATVGNRSPYTPDYSGNVGVDFFRLVGSWNFTAGLYANVVGPTWFHTVQDQKRVTVFNAVFPGLGTADYSNIRRDAYGLVDMRVGVASEKWSFTVFGNNLTNEKFLEEVITAPEFGGSFIHPGTRRRIGLEVSRRF